MTQRSSTALPSPYYEDDAVTLYHGDAIEERYCDLIVRRCSQEVLAVEAA